jgi:hypothetical protein
MGESALACNVRYLQCGICEQLLRALDAAFGQPRVRRLANAVLEGTRKMRHRQATLARKLGEGDVVADPGFEKLHRPAAQMRGKRLTQALTPELQLAILMQQMRQKGEMNVVDKEPACAGGTSKGRKQCTGEMGQNGVEEVPGSGIRSPAIGARRLSRAKCVSARCGT